MKTENININNIEIEINYRDLIDKMGASETEDYIVKIGFENIEFDYLIEFIEINKNNLSNEFSTRLYTYIMIHKNSLKNNLIKIIDEINIFDEKTKNYKYFINNFLQLIKGLEFDTKKYICEKLEKTNNFLQIYNDCNVSDTVNNTDNNTEIEKIEAVKNYYCQTELCNAIRTNKFLTFFDENLDDKISDELESFEILNKIFNIAITKEVRAKLFKKYLTAKILFDFKYRNDYFEQYFIDEMGETKEKRQNIFEGFLGHAIFKDNIKNFIKLIKLIEKENINSIKIKLKSSPNKKNEEGKTLECSLLLYSFISYSKNIFYLLFKNETLKEIFLNEIKKNPNWINNYFKKNNGVKQYNFFMGIFNKNKEYFNLKNIDENGNSFMHYLAHNIAGNRKIVLSLIDNWSELMLVKNKKKITPLDIILKNNRNNNEKARIEIEGYFLRKTLENSSQNKKINSFKQSFI